MAHWLSLMQGLVLQVPLVHPATPFSIMGLELTRSQAGKPRWLPLRQVD